MEHKLMIKTHTETGLRYLCYTRKSGKEYDEYSGSGTAWREHLETHGKDITTELIYKTTNKSKFRKYAKSKSIELDVVKSPDWANLTHESGDGGDTVSNKMWVTNGEEERYILKTDDIPDGWKGGRFNSVFSDPAKQLELARRATTEAKRAGMVDAWAKGKMDKRDNSKCGISGKMNPMSRDDKARKKLRKPIIIDGVLYDSCTSAAKTLGVSVSTISGTWKRNGRVTYV